MATPKSLIALQKTKQALEDIKSTLEPVIQRLKDDAFEKAAAQAQATISLSVGMMKYMGARLQGLDQGRNPDDPLRQELNQMRKVLAEIKSRHTEGEVRLHQGTLRKVIQKEASNDANVSSIAKVMLPKKQAKNQQSETVAKIEARNPNVESGSKKRNTDGSKRRSKKPRSI